MTVPKSSRQDLTSDGISGSTAKQRLAVNFKKNIEARNPELE